MEFFYVNVRGNLHPVQREVGMLPVASCCEIQSKLRLTGPRGPKHVFRSPNFGRFDEQVAILSAWNRSVLLLSSRFCIVRSLDGTGNFNWRMVFPFEYLPIEKKLSVKKKVWSGVWLWCMVKFMVMAYDEWLWCWVCSLYSATGMSSCSILRRLFLLSSFLTNS